MFLLSRHLMSHMIKDKYSGLHRSVKLSKFNTTFKPVKEQKLNISNRSKFVVCVEGNIGCGKTTLLNYFKTHYNFEVLAEPVEKWRDVQGLNALDLMYKDPQRWGMTLQTYIQLTMLQAHIKAQTNVENSSSQFPITLMERSIYSANHCFVDNLYQRGIMPEFEHIILSEWFDWIVSTQGIQVPLFVYIRTDPEVVYERIKERCRSEEQSIELDYLRTIHQLHEDWLIKNKKYSSQDVLVVDGNRSLEEMPVIMDQLKDRIFCHPKFMSFFLE
ncbi:unnamed protein product [Lymnaea stagnalis]|uniref:Deoxynucleoside kinase domain-containing protein n=1 Tax=Lymnaea stagnalis TaxID=6523 RepID=A0AAV2IB64_LYMST